MKLSQSQFAALTAYVEAAAECAAVNAKSNHDDDCHGIRESLALSSAREMAEIDMDTFGRNTCVGDGDIPRCLRQLAV